MELAEVVKVQVQNQRRLQQATVSVGQGYNADPYLHTALLTLFPCVLVLLMIVMCSLWCCSGVTIIILHFSTIPGCYQLFGFRR